VRRFGCLLFFCALSAAATFPGCSFAREGASSGDGNLREMRPVALVGLRVADIPAGWMVFKDQESWSRFWTQRSSQPTPEIDFEQFTLVAVFLGQRPNPGYAVRITEVREYSDRVAVHAVETGPLPDALYAQVIVYPHNAVLIGATAKEIEFKLTRGNDRSQPAASFPTLK
jgi:hypothetical protein